jgi:signal transduction histidine kinase
MLHEFIAANRDGIIALARERVESRPWPSVSPRELEFGVPMFLTQLVETLKSEAGGKIASKYKKDTKIGDTATKHGAELLGAGFNVSQVVHDYGDICQSVTELAVKKNAPITVEEFHTLNRCLDTAIAEAVTEHTRISVQTGSSGEVERLGHSAHDLRDTLNTALLAFHMLRRGNVAINGSTGEVLGRSLMSLRDRVDRALSEARLATGKQKKERLPVSTFIDEIAASGVLHSEYRQIKFTLEPVDPNLVIEGDPQLLTSAVMNLLHNAFKSTLAGGHVTLRARAVKQRLVIEVEDECGGIPKSKGDLLAVADDKGGNDRSGFGLSIARKAVLAHAGDISIRNTPGQGCVFAIEVPLAAETSSAPQPVAK